jgi:hypothetical protein
MPQLLEISGGPFTLGRVRRKKRKAKAKKTRKPKKRAKRRTVKAKRKRRAKKVPVRRLRGPRVTIRNISASQVRSAAKTIRTAKIKKAVFGIRLALVALANGRFLEAGQIAINSAIEAAAAHKQNPKMAARIFVTARGVVRSAIRGIKASRV